MCTQRYSVMSSFRVPQYARKARGKVVFFVGKEMLFESAQTRVVWLFVVTSNTLNTFALH